MFAVIRQRYSQYLGFSAILGLLATPFLCTGRSPDVGTRQASVTGSFENLSITECLGVERRIPGYDAMQSAMENVRVSRVALLKAAATQQDQAIESAVRRYQDSIAECESAFQKLCDRTDPEDGRAASSEYCTGERQEDNGRKLYSWELDRRSELPLK